MFIRDWYQSTVLLLTLAYLALRGHVELCSEEIVVLLFTSRTSRYIVSFGYCSLNNEFKNEAYNLLKFI